MTKLRALTRRQLRAIIAIVVAVCVVVPSVLVAAFHVKAADTRVSKDVAEVVTKKEAVPNGDGTYHVKIEAYNTAYSIYQIPTDTVLVLERSSRMSDVLYHRDNTNLLTYTIFTPLTGQMPHHNDLYEGNSNIDNDTGISISNDYRNNKFIKDPNNPNVFVYLEQTYNSQLYWDVWHFVYEKSYKYTIVDTNGNIYQTDPMPERLIQSGARIQSLDFKWVKTIDGSTTRPDNAVETFSINQPGQIYKRDSNDNGHAINSYIYDQYINHGGIYIKDEKGNYNPVTLTRIVGHTDDVTGSTDRLQYYKYTYTDPNTHQTYSAIYGNPVYGADYCVYQGFMIYNEDGTVNHEASIESRTLYNGEGEDVTYLLAMQESVEDFLLDVHQNAYENGLTNGQQKVGIVSYASRTEAVWNNNRLSKTEYPLTDVYNDVSVYNMIATVYAMEADGRRRIDVGMEYAKEMLDNRVYSGSKNNLDTSVNPGSAADHNVNVIAFTTGMPSTKLGGDYDTDVANTAISAARSIESSYPNANIYTIGMYYGADASQLYGDWFYRMSHANVPCDGSVGSYWGGTALSSWTNSDMSERDAAATNRFLNYLSSNFKNSATNIGLSGPKYIRPGFWSTGGTGYEVTRNFDRVSSDYYYAATDWDEVENAFEKLSQSIQVSESMLHGDTTLKDTVSDYFNIVGNVTSYTMDYDGSGDYDDSHWSNPTPIANNVDGKDVSVTDFDYAENYCADGHAGKKVVIEFDVEPIEGFLGGHDVPTNEGSSAIYDSKQQLVESLPYPEVDVDLAPEIATNDQYIYYSNETDLANLFTVSENAKGLTNDFVDVIYRVIDSDTNEEVLSYYVPAGEDVGSYSLQGEQKGEQYPVLENNKTYTITCTLNTVDEDVNERETDSAEDDATVYIYKPTLTVKDSTEEYEDAVAGVDLRENMVSVTWSAEDTEEPAPAEGVPTVSYEFYEGTDASKTRVNDYTDHSMSETTDYDVDLVIDGHNFSYDTILPYYVLADGSEVLISEYDVNTHASRVPVTITYEDEDGNPVTETLVEYDENGNEIPVYQTINKLTTVDDNKPDLRDAVKHFATYTNQTDSSKPDGNFTIYTGTPFDFFINKKFDGDYANPEAVTFTITGSDGSTQTVTIDRTDFTGQQSSNKQAATQLKTGITYTVTEGFGNTETDEAKYDTTFSGKWVDTQDTETTVTDTDGDTTNEVFVFTIPSSDQPEAMYLAVTNTDTTEYPPLTGRTDEAETPLGLIVAAACATAAAGFGAYKFYLVKKAETNG